MEEHIQDGRCRRCRRWSRWLKTAEKRLRASVSRTRLVDSDASWCCQTLLMMRRGNDTFRGNVSRSEEGAARRGCRTKAASGWGITREEIKSLVKVQVSV